MALNEQMQQMVQQDVKDAETRPKEEILKEQMEGLKTAGRTARDIAVESIPGVSEALAEKRVDEALQRGDTTGAMIEGAAGLMGAVPMVGDILSRPIRAAAKKLRKQDSDTATKMLNDVESIETWKKQNPNPKPQKQNPNIEKAANDLLEGKITGKQYRSVVKENMPIQKIEEVPEVPSFTEIVGALDKDKSAKGIIGLNKKIKDGTRVSSRLDIPAYERFDKWVVSVHDAFDKKGRESLSGDIMGYGKTAVLKNVEFKGSPTGAASISARKTDKGTIARIFGDYYNAEPENVEEYARQVIKDKDWTQVGYNPFRHGFFYDKDTGMPVKSAEEVIQVGPLVLAKNAQKMKISEAKQVGPKGGLKIRTGKPIEGLENLKETNTVFNEGGVVPMKRIAEQMELFEPVERGFEEGGLMDEGGMVDEESGNEVPPGSLREEVRDDIPAQLSEGEFVFPADVVRYIGLENLMRMRQEAKQGLAQMEAMGQMGNSEEATVQDDLPFDMYDLDIEDEDEYNSETRNYQVGGYVAPPVPFQQQPYSQPTQVNPQTGTYTLPGTGIAGYQVPSGGQTGFTPYGGAAPYFQPVQFTGPQFQTSLQTTNLPTFAETVGTSPGQYDELRTYVNDAGQILQIPFKDGKPIYPIPEGYRLQGDQPQEEAPTTIAPTTGVRQEDDRGGDGPSTTTPSTRVSGSSLFDLFSTKDTGFPKSGLTEQASFNAFANLGTQSGKGYGGSKYGLSNEAYRSGVTQLGADQLGSMSPILGGLKAIGDKLGFNTTDISFNDRAVVGNLTRQTALENLGMINPAQMYSNPQATYVGEAMQIATDAFNNGLSKDELSEALAEHAANNSGIIRATANEVSRAYMENKGFKTEGFDFFDENVATTVETLTQQDIDAINDNLTSAFGSTQGAALSSSEYGNITNKDIKSQYNSYRSRIPGTNKFVHELTPAAKRQKAKLDAQKAQLEAVQNANKVAREAEEKRAQQQAEMRARQEAEARAAGYTGFGDYSQEGKDDKGDQGDRGDSAPDRGMSGAEDTGYGSGTDCLTEKMKVKLNGVIDFVTNIKVGDMIDGSFVKEVLHKHMRGGYFIINNELEITNDHPVLANGKWTTPEELYIGDYINDVKVESINYVNRLTPTVSIVIDGDSFDVYTEGNTYTVHGRYREVRQQAA